MEIKKYDISKLKKYNLSNQDKTREIIYDKV